MSRSNPTVKTLHPSTRWFEWNGETGSFRYYDKEKKENVDIGTKFQFLVLDELATVRGYSDKLKTSFRSNEVRDTTTQPFTVRTFSEQQKNFATGFWREIKDRVVAAGGRFTANIYIAFKVGGKLQIGCIQLSGAALSVWLEFKRQNRDAVYEKAVSTTGMTEGKKGKIVFQTPIFALGECTAETAKEAYKLDQELQKHFKDYFKPKAAAGAQQNHEQEANEAADLAGSETHEEPVEPDNIPF